MKTIINKLLTCGLLLATFALHTACSDWNEPEAVDLNINSAKEQNPELWARYIQVLRSYKQSKHFITYARFDNSTENPVNEGSYLRSLPDSMDIVTLSHSDKISDYDRRDIPLLQEKSTRILYLVDFAAQASNLADAGALNNWLDKAITAAADLNLDGFAFTGIPLYGGTGCTQGKVTADSFQTLCSRRTGQAFDIRRRSGFCGCRRPDKAILYSTGYRRH